MARTRRLDRRHDYLYEVALRKVSRLRHHCDPRGQEMHGNSQFPKSARNLVKISLQTTKTGRTHERKTKEKTREIHRHLCPWIVARDTDGNVVIGREVIEGIRDGGRTKRCFVIEGLPPQVPWATTRASFVCKSVAIRMGEENRSTPTFLDSSGLTENCQGKARPLPALRGFHSSISPCF